MSQYVEQRIRERAYAIWQEKGCPDGSDHEHWLQAEREVASAVGEAATSKVAAPKTASRKAGVRKTAEKTGEAAAPKAATERKARTRKVAVTA